MLSSVLSSGFELGKYLFGKGEPDTDKIFAGAGSIFDAVTGIPSPVTADQLGLQQRQYMDQAFPGTNAWERLGQSSAVSPVQVAREQRRTVDKQLDVQSDLKNRELQVAREGQQVQRDVADKQQFSSLVGAMAPYGPKAVQMAQALMKNNYADAHQYDTPTTAMMMKVQPEIDNLNSGTKLNLERAAVAVQDAYKSRQHGRIAKAEADWAHAIQEANFTATVANTLGTTKDLLGPYLLMDALQSGGPETARSNMRDTMKYGKHAGAVSRGFEIGTDLGRMFGLGRRR